MYVPVGLWLLVFRNAPVQAIGLIVFGLLVNTMYISTYLRPKIAAEKSKVLNFYWMLVGLVTGVYTFGLVGVLLGPIVIGLLKAIIDTITATTTWRLLDDDETPRVADTPAHARGRRPADDGARLPAHPAPGRARPPGGPGGGARHRALHRGAFSG